MLRNPFLGRQLSELIASRGAVNFEGESPFNAYMNRRKLAQIDQAINRVGQRPQQARPGGPMATRQPMPQQPMAPAPVTPMPQQPMMPQQAASQFRPIATQFRGFPQWGALGMGRTPSYGGVPIGQFRGFGTGPGMVNAAANYPL